MARSGTDVGTMWECVRRYGLGGVCQGSRPRQPCLPSNAPRPRGIGDRHLHDRAQGPSVPMPGATSRRSSSLVPSKRGEKRLGKRLGLPPATAAATCQPTHSHPLRGADDRLHHRGVPRAGDIPPPGLLPAPWGFQGLPTRAGPGTEPVRVEGRGPVLDDPRRLRRGQACRLELSAAYGGLRRDPRPFRGLRRADGFLLRRRRGRHTTARRLLRRLGDERSGGAF